MPEEKDVAPVDETILHGSDAEIQILISQFSRLTQDRIVPLSRRFLAKAYTPDCLSDVMKTTELARSLEIRTPRTIRSVQCQRRDYLVMERVEGSTL
jgi:hypothetical protein